MSFTELMLRLSGQRDYLRDQAALVAEAFLGDGKTKGRRLSAKEQQRELARLKSEFRLN